MSIMKITLKILGVLIIHSFFVSCETEKRDLYSEFCNPDYVYRPVYPLLMEDYYYITKGKNVQECMNMIYDEIGYGGIMISPTRDSIPQICPTDYPSGYLKHIGNGLQQTRPKEASPWLMILPEGVTPYRYTGNKVKYEKEERFPSYLSESYFDIIHRILEYSKDKGRKVIFYDEVGYPSGIANHSVPEKYRRKILKKTENEVSGGCEYHKEVHVNGKLMAIVGMNVQTLERVNLINNIQDGILKWNVPAGKWKVMTFTCETAPISGLDLDYNKAIDYMNPEAIKWFISKVYEPHRIKCEDFWGNTIIQTFFDDVGIFDEETTWTENFNEYFIKATNGVDPSLYYPALWENIGDETQMARKAFFSTRAQLLADGFPKLLADWGEKHGIEISGHCPGNYDPQPVDMGGDPFLFYKHVDVPLADVIFSYPTGRDGFKLISDGAEFYDKPIVAAEVFNSFAPAGERMGYKRIMELYVRGINRMIGSGAPAITGDTAVDLKFSKWIGRNSLMLQGGRRISDIALYYPIEDLEAYYHFEAKDYTKDMRWGTYIPQYCDFMAIGEMLKGDLQRDFSFIHPDFLLSSKTEISNGNLVINNSQKYKVLIIPGMEVISLKSLLKIQEFYDEGGIVIATSKLPSKAAEFTTDVKLMGINNEKVHETIKAIFHEQSGNVNTSNNGGKSIFIDNVSASSIECALEKLQVSADVIFDIDSMPHTGGGQLGYIHKHNHGKDIFYIANSSDDDIDTHIMLRGEKQGIELWCPETGKSISVNNPELIEINGDVYTKMPFSLSSNKSVFIVSELSK